MGILDLIGHKYPFTDFHELNLDWCISAVLQLQKAFEEFSAGNKITFADPLQHTLTRTYAKNTIVVDPVSGTAYLSLDAVPVGVQLDNADYWLPIFDFAGYITRANQNFTDNYFSGTDRSPVPLSVDAWVVLDDVLYKVTQAIAADDLFIIGTNIIHFTVEQFLKDFVTSVNQTLNNYSLTIQQYKNDIDASEAAYRIQLASDIANTTASLQAQLDLAISGATVDSEVINARLGADGVTYPTLGDAIRTQVTDLGKTARKGRTVNNIIESSNDMQSYNLPASNNELEIVDGSRKQIVNVDRTRNINTLDFNSLDVNGMKLLHYSSHYHFGIADSNRNMIFKDTPNPLKGKKVSIIGDSISSFDGYNPTGYAYFYPRGNVQAASDTWWWKLIDELEMELLVNASWSGSRVAGDSQGTAFAACSDQRIADLASGGNTPDVILVYISTNDWANSPQVPIGTFTSTDDIPSEGTIFEIAKAYALMLYKIRTTYPAADVFCFTNFEGRLVDDTSYPILNTNNQSIHEVNHAVMEVAHIFGAEVIDLETIGVHFWNVASYTWDGTLHPNKAGMDLIKDAAKWTLTNKYYKERSVSVNMGNVLILKNADFSNVSVGDSKLLPVDINSVTVGEGYVSYNSVTQQVEHVLSPTDEFSKMLYTSGELTIPNEGVINLYGIMPIVVPTADINSVINASDASPYTSNLDKYYMYFHNQLNNTWNRRVGIKKTYKIYARKDGVIDGTYSILLGDFKLCDISSVVADKYYMQWPGNIAQGIEIGIEVPKLYWEVRD